MPKLLKEYKGYHQTNSQSKECFQVLLTCMLSTLLAETRLQGLTALLFSLTNRRLNLQLPKFSISGSYDVKTLFEQMGITEVFSGNADLSGISGNHNLQVSQVSRQSW